MDYDYGNLILTVIGLFFLFAFGNAAECRGSEVDSAGRSWIEASRPLPTEDLNYIAVRFCRAEPILLQIWDQHDLSNNQYRLLWQRELQPNATYLGQEQVFPVPEPFPLRSTYRYGITSRGPFPVETMFDSDGRTGRLSVTSLDEGIFGAGEVRTFAELTRPTYFHVWFCRSRECPSEEELIHTYEQELNPHFEDKDILYTEVPPEAQNSPNDQCHGESLHAGSGRIMLEEHTSFLPMVAKAIEFYLCDDTIFHVQLWEPMEGREYKLVWSKGIIPDQNSGGGYKRTVSLDEDEIIYLEPFYRLALHVPDENKRMPVPSTFSYSENTVFSEMKKEKFHRCDTQLFEEVAFPYNLRIKFCSTRDCSDTEETWTSDYVQQIDLLPSHECPEVNTDLTQTNTENNPQNNNNRNMESPTTEDPAANNNQQPGPDNKRNEDDDSNDDRDINRTKVTDGDNNPENELLQPGKTGKSSSSAGRVVLQFNFFTVTISWWLTLLLF